MSRYIDADALIKDTWFALIKGENIDDIAEQIIRQCKNIVKDAPTIATKQVKYFDEDEKVWKVGEVIIKTESNSEKPNNCKEDE